MSYQVPVATGSNRTTSGGAALPTVKNRTSVVLTNQVLPGQTIPMPATGTQFYIIATTAELYIRPSGGAFNPYNQGQGLQLDLVNAFDLIEVQNRSALPIAFAIFIGFDQYIDKTFILNQNFVKQVAYPTAPEVSETVIDIPDLSGAPFDDINGGKWYALSREAIYVFNPDTGVTLSLLAAGATAPSDPAVAMIYPTTSLRYPSSGNFRITAGGGPINVIVSEIYQAIPRTT